MKKRIISIMLIAIIGVISVISLASYSKKKESTLTMGQWLTMVDSAFGMDSYISDEPYFSNVSSDSPYFAAVQIAAEWDVIDKDGNINVDQKLTWKDALITLVNVGGFIELDATDSEKIEYAIKNFDGEIRTYWMNREISAERAVVLLGIAQEKWASLIYSTPIEETKYAEGVKDFSQGENKFTDYILNEDGNIIIPESSEIKISEGDIYILPSNGDVLGTNAYKADNITIEDGYMYIENSLDELDLYDIAESIYVEGTYEPDIKNTVIRDGNGNIISVGNNVVTETYQQGDYSENSLLYTTYRNNNITQLANGAVKHTFEVDGFEVGLKYNLDGKFDLEVSLESDNLLDVPKSSNRSLKFEGSIGINSLSVTNKIDFSWFKLKEASLKVDYETELSFGIKYEDSFMDKVVAPKLSNGNGKYLTNFKNLAFKDRKAKGNGAKTIKIASVDIYSIGVARVCLDINVKVEIDGSLSVSITEKGTKGLEYKNGNLRAIKDTDKDIDAKIKANIEGTVGIGPALYTVGLKKPILGLQVAVGLGAEVDITMHLADSENHLLEEGDASDVLPEAMILLQSIDLTAEAEAIKTIAKSLGFAYSSKSEDVKLHIDNCIDVSIYFILKLELTDHSYAADLLGGKIKVSWEICNKKNAKLFNFHCDNGDWASAFANITFGGSANKDKCTLKYVSFDEIEEESSMNEDNTEQNGIELEETTMEEHETQGEEETTKKDNEEVEEGLEGETLILSEIKAYLEVGENYYYTVQKLPKGYSLDDLMCTSGNSSIVEVDSNGGITAKKEGSTVLTISTKDGKYKAYCAVTVLSTQMDNIIHLN